MDKTASFRELMHRVRQRDEEAARQVVSLYEPEIRREVRLRLTMPAARRVLDSDDICQSVMGAFFVRMADGQYDIQEPRQLVALLVKIARNRVIDLGRRQQAAKRIPPEMVDVPLLRAGRSGVVREQSSPSQHVCRQELLDQCRRRLSAEEHQIIQQRAGGRGWNEIAREFGQTAGALRKRMARAIDRITRELRTHVR